MAGDGSDAFEDDAEPTVTIGEYIEGIEAEELEADLVLGGDDGKECTYGGGYLKRQAVFSCLTCVPAGAGGVCTACSLACHDGHEGAIVSYEHGEILQTTFRGNALLRYYLRANDYSSRPNIEDGPDQSNLLGKMILCAFLQMNSTRYRDILFGSCAKVVELWTKRKFRCDCGNSKFGGHLCKLCPEKDPDNPANSYNHNFKGSYCTCGRPYPDPEAKEQVEMIQCCICEDWFHEDHIGLNSIEEIPRDEEGEPLYEDFICHKCSPVCYFLKFYPDTIWASTKQNSSPQAGTTDSNVMEGGPSGHANIEKPENGALVDHMSSEKNSVEDDSAKDIAAPEKANLDNNSGGNCKLGMGINIISAASADSEKKMPFFMCKGWREILCRCETCTNFYAQQGIAYLIDKEDSIEEYEKIAKQKREKKLEQQEGAEANFLNSLNHVQKIEILSGISDMKNEFQSFLESFDPSKPVTSEDIRSVFENLSKKKKQRLS